jgi:hypothetical protein
MHKVPTFQMVHIDIIDTKQKVLHLATTEAAGVLLGTSACQVHNNKLHHLSISFLRVLQSPLQILNITHFPP